MRIPVPSEVCAPDELGVVHLIGIGGVGLSAIARLLAEQGVVVQGSDALDSVLLEELRAEGIVCFVGHDASHLDGTGSGPVTTVIASTAVDASNVEIVEAQRRGLRLWPRSAGLKSAMWGRRLVAVAGTHGKTTTTAMTTCALLGAGMDPGFSIGAAVPTLGTNARVGSDDVLVVEADESDGAFLQYSPASAVITNVDADHLEMWGSVEAYVEAFGEFAETVSDFLVVCADDANAMSVARVARARGLRVVSAGTSDSADVRAQNVDVSADGTSFVARTATERIDVRLLVSGEHYAVDAVLALAAALELGADLGSAVAGLERYTGAARRMEFKGEAAGIRVFDSYAHHPTEIASDLAAARRIAGAGSRLVVAFQPHLVSRTRLFGAQMGVELSAADLVFVADLYLAREAADPAVTSDIVLASVQGPEAFAVGPVESAASVIVPRLRSGDLFVTLGAGDITLVGPRVLEALDADE